MNIRESAKDDIDHSHEAEEARHALLAHLKTLNPNSVTPTPISFKGWSKRWSNVGVHFDTQSDGDAEIRRYTGGNFLIVYGMRFKEQISDAIEMISSLEGASTFRHEFIHFIDMRDKRNVSRNYSMSEISPKMTNSEIQDFSSRYFNDPSEMNAYAHEMMEPLLLLLRQARDSNYSNIRGGEFEIDFHLYAVEFIKNLDKSNQVVWRQWNADAKKIFLKRLADLHKAIIDIREMRNPEKNGVMSILRNLVKKIRG
jgi:hypothetical protein